MQIQAEPGKIGPAIHIYSLILYQFLSLHKIWNSLNYNEHLQSVPLFTMNHVSQIFRYVRYVRYIRLFEANEYNDK